MATNCWREEIDDFRDEQYVRMAGGMCWARCDPAEPEFIVRMRKHRLPATAAPKEQDLARNLIKQRLANTREGNPGGLTIAKECVNTIPEFMRYHMPEGKNRPVDVDTHGIKALHFLILGLSLEARARVRWL
jgi:hypothetical protein